MGSLLTKASPKDLLARILEESALVAEVRALPAPLLAKLIDHVGLEDAGEIVDLATTSQIERVFDEDLWKSPDAGEDEAFDEARFITWLEILLEAGESRAARRLAELSEDVLTFAMHRLVLVVDLDELAARFSEPGEEQEEEERAIEGALSQEIGSYLVFARTHDGWDAIVTALVALDEVEHRACVRLLDRCAALTEREIEEAPSGLSEVLSAADTLAEDVAGDRADRRARDGFVAPSDARAFLKLARTMTIERIAAEGSHRDPVTRAYFRELDRNPPPAVVARTRLTRLLEDAGVLTATKKKRVKALPPSASKSTLTLALEALSDAESYGARMEELAFLVNVLVSGGARARAQARAWRPAEAAEAVLFVANAGLEKLAVVMKVTAADLLAKVGVIPAFQTGIQLGMLEAFALPD